MDRVKKESIEQGARAAPPAFAIERRARPRGPIFTSPLAVMPDCCNLGIALRIVLGVNGGTVIFAALVSESLAQWLAQCLNAATMVEPILIASLFSGCVLRTHARRVPETVQVALMLILPAVFALLLQIGLAPLLQINDSSIIRNGLLASVASAVVMYWAYLHHQANYPAVAEARLQALQARIRPHFLFNSLNAVLGLIRTDPKRAETSLEDLSELFRVLMRDHRERIPLHEEIALCQSYLEIEGLRLGERLRVHWSVDATAGATLVPSLLLQPLVENAVHHGIEPSVAPGTIDIGVQRTGNFVDIVISNPYLGLDLARAGNSMGLDNVRQRLALVFDLEGRLETGIQEGRFHVRLRVPFVER